MVRAVGALWLNKSAERRRKPARAKHKDLRPAPGPFLEIQLGFRLIRRNGFHDSGIAIVGWSRSLVRALARSLQKIIQTPARTKHAPSSDQSESFSPPNNQPRATAPGGVMSEMVWRLVTLMRGISQYK